MFEAIGEKMRGTVDDRGVSPVIGVILMVAITVILAAVIAAFVLDLGDQSEPVTAAVDVNYDGSDVVATLQDASNVDSIDHADASCGSGQVFDVEGGDGVGSSTTLGSCSDGDRVVLTGSYDGNTEIIVDREA